MTRNKAVSVAAACALLLTLFAGSLNIGGWLKAAAQETDTVSAYNGKTLSFRSSSDGSNVSLGMWVWDIRVLNGDDPRLNINADVLLDMLVKNHATEIYLGCSYLMDDDQVTANGGVLTPGYVGESQLHAFVKRCSAAGIRVSLLTACSGSEVYDLWDAGKGYASTVSLLERIAAINSRAGGDDEKLTGLHIDLEPDWNTGSDGQPGLPKNLQDCADYVTAVRRMCYARGLELALDVSAWLDDSSYTVTDENKQTTTIMDVLTKQCQSLVIMAYRDNADQQYELASGEIAYAVKNGCRIIVGAECGSRENMTESWNITYDNVGADAMITAQNSMRQKLDTSGCLKYGIAVHDSYAFYTLMTAPTAEEIAQQPDVGSFRNYQISDRIADQSALGVPSAVDNGVSSTYRGSYSKYYSTRYWLAVDITVKSGSTAQMQMKFSYTPQGSSQSTEYTVDIGQLLGGNTQLTAGEYRGFINLKKIIPFGAVPDGTTVSTATALGSAAGGGLQVNRFELVTAEKTPLTTNEYTDTNGKTYQITGIMADKQAMGLPTGSPSVLNDTNDESAWYHEPSAKPIYHSGEWLAVDITVNQGQGGDALVPLTVRFGDPNTGTQDISVNSLLGHSRGLRPGSYKLLIDPAKQLQGLTDGTPYYGSIIELRGLYGGNVTIRQFGLVMAQEVDSSTTYTLGGKTYQVSEVTNDMADLNIPTQSIDTEGSYGPAQPVSCGGAEYLLYDFTVSGSTVYLDADFNEDTEAGSLKFDRALGTSGLPVGTYQGVIPLKGSYYGTALKMFDYIKFVKPEGGSIAFHTFSFVNLQEITPTPTTTATADPTTATAVSTVSTAATTTSATTATAVTEETTQTTANQEPASTTTQTTAAESSAYNLLPSQWSGEGSLVPVQQADGGWLLQAASGGSGGNAIGYFNTTYQQGWKLAYDFTIDGTSAVISIKFPGGLNDSQYPQGQKEYVVSKEIAAQYGIQPVGTDANALPAGTYKGVLDVCGFFPDGFSQFQNLAVYLDGQSISFRKLQFASGLSAGTCADKPSIENDTDSDGKSDNINAEGSVENAATGSSIPETAIVAALASVLVSGGTFYRLKRN